jgi:hypothetical protein
VIGVSTMANLSFIIVPSVFFSQFLI